jgi:protein TonB
MAGRLKFGAVLLTLGCFASAEVRPPPPALSEAELLRVRAEREREEMEDVIRLSVYHECGGDRELRCQQLAPRILRAIPPAVPLRAVECEESGRYPRRVRRCAFALGSETGPSAACRVTLRELPGHHSLYWSDELPPPPSPPEASPGIAIPAMGFGRSSLSCDGPLLALTREPERVDPAPATPPRPTADLATLITEDDRPIPALSQGKSGTVAMRLRIGSHGRIDRCSVIRSSGSEALDEAACSLLRARAFFLPAQDGEGRAVAAEISHSHEWAPPR